MQLADELQKKDEVGPWISFYTGRFMHLQKVCPKIESQSAAAANFARAHGNKAISPQRRG
jgi:hypothetical protein